MRAAERIRHRMLDWLDGVDGEKYAKLQLENATLRDGLNKANAQMRRVTYREPIGYSLSTSPARKEIERKILNDISPRYEKTADGMLVAIVQLVQ